MRVKALDILVTLVAILTTVAVVQTGSAGAAVAVDHKDFGVFAHRGYWLEGPTENTKRAVRRAADAGATAVEVDVRMSRDGVFMILHDKTLHRTTDCAGWLHRKRARAVRQNCLTDDGQRVPFAYGILKQARRLGLTVALEVKADPRGRWTQDKMRHLARVIDRAEMRPMTMVISFDRSLLRLAESVMPDVETQWITNGTPTLFQARHADGVALRLEDRHLAARFDSAGYRVQGRRVETELEWQQFADAGVHEVIVDSVTAFRNWSQVY